jgi:hypothetical protein
VSRAVWLRELAWALDTLAVIIVACERADWPEGLKMMSECVHALRTTLAELGCDALELDECTEWLASRISHERVRAALSAADDAHELASTDLTAAQADANEPACARVVDVQAAPPPFELATPVAARRTPRGGTKQLRASVRRAAPTTTGGPVDPTS